MLPLQGMRSVLQTVPPCSMPRRRPLLPDCAHEGPVHPNGTVTSPLHRSQRGILLALFTFRSELRGLSWITSNQHRQRVVEAGWGKTTGQSGREEHKKLFVLNLSESVYSLVIPYFVPK